jgi:membrane protease YdiL (CAAX protease family)
MGMLVASPFFGSDLFNSVSISGGKIDPQYINQFKYLQIVSQLGMFIFPALIFGYFSGNKMFNYLGFNKVKISILLLSGCIILLYLPLSNWFATVNSWLSLPESLSGLEIWMKNSENEANALTEAFLNTSSYKGLLVNILMIGILPAIGEELIFRGVLQKLFIGWTKNVHIGIIVAALVFSFIHFQFYGFLPRFILGVMFGYLFVWSGSLWAPILVHFINNTSIVIVGFLYAKGIINIDINNFGSTTNPFILICSLIFVSVLVFIVYNKRVVNDEINKLN